MGAKSVLSSNVTNNISWCRRQIYCFSKLDLATLLLRLKSSGTRLESVLANANVFHYKSLLQIRPYPYCALVQILTCKHGVFCCFSFKSDCFVLFFISRDFDRLLYWPRFLLEKFWSPEETSKHCKADGVSRRLAGYWEKFSISNHHASVRPHWLW